MYMISRPSREPGIEARMPIEFGPTPSGSSGGSQRFTVAHSSGDLSTVGLVPEDAAGSARAPSSNTTQIPVRDDTSSA